jgi:hypothetical protein
MCKLLIKYASRERPERFLAGMDNIFSTVGNIDNIRVVVSADIDDASMNSKEMMDKINSFPNTIVYYGTSKNKIDATNRDLDSLPPGFEDWDIIANYADDQRFTAVGWDMIIMSDFRAVSPDFSHYIAYLDPDTNGALSTLYIAGRKFYERFGFIYDPEFISLFCDNLVEDCAKALGKYHFNRTQIYRHHNPAYGYKRFEVDDMFKRQQAVGWDIDQKTYYRIKNEGIFNYLEKFKNRTVA